MPKSVVAVGQPVETATLEPSLKSQVTLAQLELSEGQLQREMMKDQQQHQLKRIELQQPHQLQLAKIQLLDRQLERQYQLELAKIQQNQTQPLLMSDGNVKPEVSTIDAPTSFEPVTTAMQENIENEEQETQELRHVIRSALEVQCMDWSETELNELLNIAMAVPEKHAALRAEHQRMSQPIATATTETPVG